MLDSQAIDDCASAEVNRSGDTSVIRILSIPNSFAYLVRPPRCRLPIEPSPTIAEVVMPVSKPHHDTGTRKNWKLRADTLNNFDYERKVDKGKASA